MLHRVADELNRRKDEIARIITLENGKPIAQSNGEVAMAEDHLRWFAEEGRRVYGRVIAPQAKGKRHLVVKTPIGVVGAIALWNFPLVLSVRKAAPALVAGLSGHSQAGFADSAVSYRAGRVHGTGWNSGWRLSVDHRKRSDDCGTSS